MCPEPHSGCFLMEATCGLAVQLSPREAHTQAVADRDETDRRTDRETDRRQVNWLKLPGPTQTGEQSEKKCG
ncbi:unnamed protein product [Pleuronectes platessa]|uniref:Uncharacterized protein n=1 Tax=Pleuronectes platessa TaxID=8262 RepID=A0A9N7YTG3_PLEPL|nr:unnamed protein product [Pleuronectes platessa]